MGIMTWTDLLSKHQQKKFKRFHKGTERTWRLILFLSNTGYIINFRFINLNKIQKVVCIKILKRQMC
jgi:hypothetical protein